MLLYMKKRERESCSEFGEFFCFPGIRSQNCCSEAQMDDTEDDAGYPLNPHSGKNELYSSGSTQLPRHPQAIGNCYVNDDIDEDENEDDEENGTPSAEDEKVKNNGAEGLVKGEEDDTVGNTDDDDDEDDDGLHHYYNDPEDNGNVDYGKDNYFSKMDDGDLERHPKKRRLDNLISRYEFAPRVAPRSAAAPNLGGRNSLMDWTEHETFVLLDAWGDRFLQLGRKSLRCEEWHEVAEKVLEVSKFNRTDTQCRNRLDTLKKKYKKEKMRLAGSGGAGSSKWVYFRKMDLLMSSSSRQGGLSCGVDSGEYIFKSPNVYLNHSGSDEMQDSPGKSESSAGKWDDDLDCPLHKRPRSRRSIDGRSSSFRLLADSIQKFSEMYEKIENRRRRQMVELEKMRMDFHRELELQKRQILEKAQADLAKICGDDDEEDDRSSAENFSG